MKSIFYNDDGMFEQTWVLEGEGPAGQKVILVSVGDDPKRWKFPDERMGRKTRKSLGLIRLASHLIEADGFEFLTARPVNDDEFAKLSPDAILGFQTLPSNYLVAVRLANLAKEHGAKTVVFGGHYAGNIPGQVLTKQPAVDFVVAGPGEKTFSDIIHNRPFNHTSGLSFRESPWIGVTITPGKGHDWYALPQRAKVHHELWPRGEEKCSVVHWQDGCLNRCGFCTIRHFGLSRTPIPQVLEEMELLAKLGYDTFEDAGDNFCTGGAETVEYLRELRQGMVERSLMFDGLIHTATNTLLDPYSEMLEAVANIGIHHLQIGMESGGSLKPNAKTSLEQEKKLFTYLKRRGHNIKLFASYIFGLQYETRQSMEETREAILRLLDFGIVEGLQIDLCWPAPGSPYFDLLCKQHGEFRFTDYIPADELMRVWFKEHTAISFDVALKFRNKLAAEVLPALKITGAMNY